MHEFHKKWKSYRKIGDSTERNRDLQHTIAPNTMSSDESAYYANVLRPGWEWNVVVDGHAAE